MVMCYGCSATRSSQVRPVGQMIAALMKNMCVGIERDTSDRKIIPQKERAFGEVTVHKVENSLTIAAAL